jgi:hypothetical protein
MFTILRVIASGWVFQLNGDATFSFCRVAVDMIGLGGNSVGNQNHPLCWSIIPHNTEAHLAQYYQIMGWGNFTREVLGIDPNTCKNHLLGDCLYFAYKQSPNLRGICCVCPGVGGTLPANSQRRSHQLIRGVVDWCLWSILCHAMHGGTNNNMGVEVDWRVIKELCPPSATLATFSWITGL